MEMPTLTGWKRTAAYAVFFALAFLLALQRTFPTQAVKERLMLEAAAQGWQLQMGDISASGFGGVRATNVTLESRDGLRLPIEEMTASLRFWPLLLGRRSLAFEAALFEGRLSGITEQGRGWQRLRVRGQGIDLSRAAPLRRATGLDLTGTLRADVDVTLFAKEPAKSTGHADFTVERAAVNGGEVPIPGMGGGLSLPRMSLGTVTAHAVVEQGRAVVKKLEAKSEDLELTSDDLTITLQPRLEYSPLYGRARVKLADSFWQNSGSAGLRGLAEMALASARGRDGSYGVLLSGTLSRPQARPSPQ
jgi:type II secretion system protein N